MLKTVKGKVITGVVAVGLISSAGGVFASTDAGENLKDWYNAKFGQSTASIETQSKDFAYSKVGELNNEYNGLKTDASNSINTTREDETASASAGIESSKNEHINALTAKEGEIKEYMDDQFDAISLAANSVINSVGSQVSNYAYNDLTKYTDKKGEEAITQVNEDLTASNEAAVEELKEAIASAKSELQTKLDTETETTVDEIKDTIDAKIVELRGTITSKKDELVANHQSLIANKAQELENTAKADLDAVVSGING